MSLVVNFDKSFLKNFPRRTCFMLRLILESLSFLPNDKKFRCRSSSPCFVSCWNEIKLDMRNRWIQVVEGINLWSLLRMFSWGWRLGYELRGLVCSDSGFLWNRGTVYHSDWELCRQISIKFQLNSFELLDVTLNYYELQSFSTAFQPIISQSSPQVRGQKTRLATEINIQLLNNAHQITFN
jgi:hypothetical protein